MLVGQGSFQTVTYSHFIYRQFTEMAPRRAKIVGNKKITDFFARASAESECEDMDINNNNNIDENLKPTLVSCSSKIVMHRSNEVKSRQRSKRSGSSNKTSSSVLDDIQNAENIEPPTKKPRKEDVNQEKNDETIKIISDFEMTNITAIEPNQERESASRLLSSTLMSLCAADLMDTKEEDDLDLSFIPKLPVFQDDSERQMFLELVNHSEPDSQESVNWCDISALSDDAVEDEPNVVSPIPTIKKQHVKPRRKFLMYAEDDD